MVEVDQLVKTYGETRAVAGITFRADPGQVFGLLGPNGAGKTTTIGCISGLLAPTSGRVSVMGHDVVKEPRAAKSRLGVVPQEIALYEDLSAQENLAYWGSAQGMRGAGLRARIEEVLGAIGLQDRAKEPVKRYSGGMKRRLNLGASILHRPKVLVLDEPTVGVDPQSRVKLLDFVRNEARGGTCILYTTHYMEEAEAMCDRLAIVDAGKIVASGTLAELRAASGAREMLRLTGDFNAGKARLAMERVPGSEVLHADEATLLVALANASSNLPEVFAALSQAGAEVRSTTLTQPSLESLFIKLTGKELRE